MDLVLSAAEGSRYLAAEGGYQSFVLGRPEWALLIGSAATAVLALIVGAGLGRSVLAEDRGTPAMIEFKGSVAGQKVGQAVADAGDLNDDGYADFAFSSAQPASGNSKVWVIYGDPNISAASVDVSLASPTLSNCSPLQEFWTTDHP